MSSGCLLGKKIAGYLCSPALKSVTDPKTLKMLHAERNVANVIDMYNAFDLVVGNLWTHVMTNQNHMYLHPF